MLIHDVKEVFNRYEQKYVIGLATYLNIIDIMRPHLIGDEYGDENGYYTVKNLYFDTEDNFFHQQNLDSEFFRQKLRLRTYTSSSADEGCFIEIKKKYSRLVNKRRTWMKIGDAYRVLGLAGEPEEGAAAEIPGLEVSNRQIFDEIAYFIHFYKPEPKMVLCYDRQAFISKEDPELRITFDRNIRARVTDFLLERESDGEIFIPEDIFILEIKTAKSIPLWLSQLLSTNQIYCNKFSKYSTGVSAGILEAI